MEHHDEQYRVHRDGAEHRRYAGVMHAEQFAPDFQRPIPAKRTRCMDPLLGNELPISSHGQPNRRTPARI